MPLRACVRAQPVLLPHRHARTLVCACAAGSRVRTCMAAAFASPSRHATPRISSPNSGSGSGTASHTGTPPRSGRLPVPSEEQISDYQRRG